MCPCSASSLLYPRRSLSPSSHFLLQELPHKSTAFPTSLQNPASLTVSCNGFYLLSPGQMRTKCSVALGPPHLLRERSAFACMSHLLWRAVRASLRSSPRCNLNHQMDLRSKEGKDKLILKENQMYAV